MSEKFFGNNYSALRDAISDLRSAIQSSDLGGISELAADWNFLVAVTGEETGPAEENCHPLRIVMRNYPFDPEDPPSSGPSTFEVYGDYELQAGEQFVGRACYLILRDDVTSDLESPYRAMGVSPNPGPEAGEGYGDGSRIEATMRNFDTVAEQVAAAKEGGGMEAVKAALEALENAFQAVRRWKEH